MVSIWYCMVTPVSVVSNSILAVPLVHTVGPFCFTVPSFSSPVVSFTTFSVLPFSFSATIFILYTTFCSNPSIFAVSSVVFSLNVL